MTSAVSNTLAAGSASEPSAADAPGATDAAAFSTATASSSGGAGLTVSGNTINTGRYVITASNDYERPQAMGGGSADDGSLSVYDTVTHSSVDVFGDPHVYTSAGDRANFQADGLTLNLADGTEIQFKPTAETDGVSHLDEVAVSKNDQTVVQSGFYGGTVSTGAIQQGAPTTAQGFNDVRDTVLNAASDGSLGTLVNTMGATLQSTGSEQSLDGMGGGVSEFASQGGTQAVQQYGSALSSNAGSGQGPNAASEPQQSGAAATSSGNSQLIALLQQLVSLLQGSGSGAAASSGASPQAGAGAQSAGGSAASAQPAASQPTRSEPASSGADPTSNSGADPTSNSGAASTSTGAQGGEASTIQTLMSLLQQMLGQQAGSGNSQVSSLIGQLLPMLQKLLDSLSSGGGAAGAGSVPLMQQLVGSLQGQGGAASSAATTQPGATAQAAASPPSYDPSMGISSQEIQAMLANANGTGPEVNFADYDEPASNSEQIQSSPGAGDQVAGLGAQMGGEAA